MNRQPRKDVKEINKDLDEVLVIILDIRTIYIKNLNQANNVKKQYNQIYTITLRLE